MACDLKISARRFACVYCFWVWARASRAMCGNCSSEYSMNIVVHATKIRQLLHSPGLCLLGRLGHYSHFALAVLHSCNLTDLSTVRPPCPCRCRLDDLAPSTRSTMCRFVSQITVYKCGAVEHVEIKDEDCKRRECINSKKHPSNCAQESFLKRLARLFSSHEPKPHGPGCRNYRELSFAFMNRPMEQCSDKSCKLVQDQNNPSFKAAVEAIRAFVFQSIREQEQAEHDAASTRQLRDEPIPWTPPNTAQ
ncbi:uncharacterized protein FOMMEDRAFT_152476 [Fomitiporia mediterranea MF3/22]|uniref:uncharacterized protein n=1 Tax=Fomitiporia mediterranea (strain MF3/22) TaxID=694068 RepID=UPI00044085C2|nr:uncharacterized protein FOMMEDRAFT_152476 [Fomitiporia mediterranea MF3/22]EJD07119.1 hypothetical protein FOMMEDRAFT_152476 [Fomitiporia mediterranea MF3/22]